MKIDKLEINEYLYSCFESDTNDGQVHIKQLPYLSVVQSKCGSYGIKIDQSKEYLTGEGGFFIAPSVSTQHITHHADKNGHFEARYIFLDVIVNGKYRLDDIFDFPIVTDESRSAIFNDIFDAYEKTENICDRMCCVYNLIKRLLEISEEKKNYRKEEVFPVIEYIRSNYRKNITVEELAIVSGSSKSKLHSIFKEETGLSPVKYLNEYRLSVALRFLEDTNMNVGEIAVKAGFYDLFHFSKMFKSKYGVSPKNYRKIKKY